MNIFDKSKKNICIRKSVSSHQVVFFYCFLYCDLCFVAFYYYRRKIENNASDLQVQKIAKYNKKIKERVIEPSKKTGELCDSRLDDTDTVELKDDRTINQKQEDITKNTKEKYYLA